MLCDLTGAVCGCVQNHQIDQLKEEISGKDLALVKEHFDHMKVGMPNLAIAISSTAITASSVTQSHHMD